MNEPIFEVWRAVNEAAMAEDVSLIRRLVADAGIQPGVHVGRDPSEFTPVITAEWALGQWADMIDNGSPFLNSARNISISFRRCLANDCRYRVPASWSWSPEPPAPAAGDDLRDVVRLLDLAWGVIANADGWSDDTSWRQAAERWRDGYHRLLDDIRTPAPSPVPPQPADEGAGPSGPPWYLAQDVWMALGGDSNAFEAWAHHEDDRRTWGDAWAQIIAAIGGSRMEGDRNPPPGTILDLPSYQWVRESPAPSPVPPWPGDDDWWVNNDQMVAHLDTVWVEVRAPRAVPEPETERVPWWAAVGRWTTGDELIVEVARTSVVPVVTVEGGGRVRVAPDGTVEVLRRDGDR